MFEAMWARNADFFTILPTEGNELKAGKYFPLTLLVIYIYIYIYIYYLKKRFSYLFSNDAETQM